MDKAGQESKDEAGRMKDEAKRGTALHGASAFHPSAFILCFYYCRALCICGT
jgi:hypothetical protein